MAPPAVPSMMTLPAATVLSNAVVPRRSSAVAPAIVVETFDFEE